MREKKFSEFFSVFFAVGNEWGLPLAIAANLHMPYRIKIGLNDLNDLHMFDSIDKCKFFFEVKYRNLDWKWSISL